MLIPHKINNFLALSTSERKLFIRALLLVPIFALRVWCCGFKKINNWLNRQKPEEHKTILPSEEALATARRTTRLLMHAIHYSLIKGKCLSQSLVLYHLLERQGIYAEIRIGVNKNDGNLPFGADNFNAHAWVEYQNQVLNEKTDVYERYFLVDDALKPQRIDVE